MGSGISSGQEECTLSKQRIKDEVSEKTSMGSHAEKEIEHPL
jgi:hypothetical protein